MKNFMCTLCLGLLLILSAISPVFGQETASREACLQALTDSFQKLPREEVNEFLKIQGELTLNRLSWAYLKNNKAQGSLEKIETTILQLLDEKYTRTDEAFIAAREAFESKPLSREALANISPYLSELLKAQNADQKNTEDDPFIINTSDLKLLDILSQFEESDTLNSNHSSANSILNFAKIINSSFSGLTSAEIPANIDFIEDHIQDLNTDLIHILNEIPAPEACLKSKEQSEEMECAEEPIKLGDLFSQDNDLQAILMEMLQSQFLSDHKLYYGLKYGEIWQKVKKAPKVIEEVVEEEETISSDPVKTASPKKAPIKKKKKKVSSSSSIKSSSSKISASAPKSKKAKAAVVADDPAQDWFQDPVHIIVNNKKGRTAAAWKGYDKPYLEAFAKAIYENEKAFKVGDKIFSSDTGKQISVDSVLAKLNLTGLSQAVKNEPAATRAAVAEAILNKKKTFVVNGTLYQMSQPFNAFSSQSPFKTKTLKDFRTDPMAIIISNRKTELKVTRTLDDYKGMSKPYLTAMANAISNKQPTFWVGKKQYDTASGRDKLSPFLSTKKYVNYDNYEVEKRKSFKLSQIDLVRKYHLDHAANMKCDKYAVIDKTNAQLQIYKNNGQKIYEVEVLLGAVKSDQKTKFLNYDLKRSNNSTGAGIYTLGEVRDNAAYYNNTYNGNLYSLNDENGNEGVIAIHQVPTNLTSRNRLFDGDPSNNRVSGGCINLKKSDFEHMKNIMGTGCKVYVLPEEEGNRLVLKNDQLNLTTDKRMASREVANYNFTEKNREYRPIKIDVNPKIYQDFEKDILEKRIKDPKPYVTTFTRTLETEKKELMELYGLDTDDYNELSRLAFGIMGQESAFGTHAKLWTKENTQGLISALKCAKQSLKTLKRLSVDIKCEDSNSRGLTQIKQIPDKIKTKYPEVTEKTLSKPRPAAIATVGFLAEILVELKGIVAKNKNEGTGVQVSRAEIMDYMIYLYNGSRYKLKTDDKEKQATPETNIYYKNTQKYSSYLTIREYR